MRRLARVIAPCCPRHITQRGDRRRLTFFRGEDYRVHLSLPADLTAGRDIRWADDLREDPEAAFADAIARHERTGRPMGEKPFLQKLESLLGRDLLPKQRGRPKQPGQ